MLPVIPVFYLFFCDGILRVQVQSALTLKYRTCEKRDLACYLCAAWQDLFQEATALPGR